MQPSPKSQQFYKTRSSSKSRFRQRRAQELAKLEQEFEQGLDTATESLDLLKQRYFQVKTDQLQQIQLQDQLTHIQIDLTQPPSLQLNADLKQLQQQINDLEVALESRLFSWDGFREVFWQAVRFGGLGILLGWLLKTWAG